MNTRGFTPGAHDWKLFEIDGFTLLIEQGPNEAGDGWGIHYKTTVAEISDVEVSIWVGNANENPRTEQAFRNAFAGIDEDKARAGLQMLFDNIAPLVSQ